ncbi:MAG: alpha/beta fold hydrolase [Bacillota bacterium]|jgi:pimeloyl-ACP methyl ester carboxylesterase
MEFKLKEKEIKGQKLFYKQAGEGKDLILLHGWGVDSSAFEPVARELAQYFNVYNIDFPGFGLTPAPEAAWSVHDYAALIEDFIELQHIKDPLIMGHSFGGRVAILLGAKKIPSKMVLIDSAGILPKRSINYYLKVYSYKAAKKFFSLPGLRKKKDQALAYWQKNSASSDYKQAEGVMRQIFVKVVNEDLKPYLPHITASTLLVWGDLDTATPLADGQLMEKLIPDSGLVVLEGAGHYSYLERLPQFLHIIDTFLADDKFAE